MRVDPARWARREPPLAPAAVLGLGPTARALGRRLLARPDLGGLTAVAGDDLLLVIGEGDLPWADGVTYLGREPEAPGLLVPTWARPPVSPTLLARALDAGDGVAVALDPPLRIPLAGARALDRDRLTAWVARR